MRIRFIKQLFNHWHFSEKNEAEESISLKKCSQRENHMTISTKQLQKVLKLKWWKNKFFLMHCFENTVSLRDRPLSPPKLSISDSLFYLIEAIIHVVQLLWYFSFWFSSQWNHFQNKLLHDSEQNINWVPQHYIPKQKDRKGFFTRVDNRDPGQVGNCYTKSSKNYAFPCMQKQRSYSLELGNVWKPVLDACSTVHHIKCP